MNAPSVSAADSARGQADLNRRQFLRNALALSTAGPLARRLALNAADAPGPDAASSRPIKLGVVGCGGRGGWIARLFKQHGGYDLHAVADYFQPVADACGDAVGTAPARRFSGLHGYRKVLESGVEAVALETPPFFFPEHVKAAVEAGVHVYMAKPVAVDVPGCLEVEAAAARSKANARCFFVDYQMPTDPHNQEIVRMIQAGELGPLATLNSHYYAGTFPDPPFTDTLESRLQRLTWCNDVALGGGYHVNACIHALDAALWVAGARPIAASALSRRMREDPHGDSHDVFDILLEFENGLVLSHRGKHLNNRSDFDVAVEVQGQLGVAWINYGGQASLKARDNGYRGEVVNLYEAGAVRNIATFHQLVRTADCKNTTVRRATDSCLATILGREAALRRTRLTLTQLLQENTRLALDLRGLKA